MPHLLRLTLITLLALGITGCASLTNQDPLRVDLVGLEPLPGQELEMRFAVKLRVQNPNDQAVEFNGVALDLDINGQPLASGVSDQQGSIARFGETLITVPLSISAFSAVRQAWGAANYQPGQGLPYTIQGKLAGGLFGTHRFRDSGTLTWPEQVNPY
ncbi:Water stress/hypersensitive response domain-containing protein [Pseudomonas sp. 8Z]|uniref:LEA type 2 family protein n=1 Tax=Pseudomonas sp. 8Z TaxID=2653166 RepID=UPI0012F2572A|nr:LEA type 2 family protein [Pseudomonas sp. 8Z]VXC49465.1 Water stress/hypersensitive response domain-containing protein [Pseudomonas sp. 8Z]